jgi:hypothetical protein
MSTEGGDPRHHPAWSKYGPRYTLKTGYDRHVQTESAVELHGTLSLPEVTRFQYFHTLRRSWTVAAVFAVILILLMAFTALTLIVNPEPDWRAMLMDATPFTLFLLLWVLLIGVMPYRNARKQFATQSYLREPITYVFTSATVSATGASASWTLAWSVLKRVRETKSLFLLYHGPNIAMIVPKRFFQSPAEMEKWRQLVLESMATKRIEKPGVIGRWC